MKLKNLIFICSLALPLGFASCSSDDNGEGGAKVIEKAEVSGNIEKGPFVQGSKVTLYELESNLSQTGKSFRTQTNSDLGAFAFDSPIQLNSQFVELETSGYFYNEVKGELSTSQITLNALSNVANRNSVNVNLITHLEYGRVKKLVRDGIDFTAAKKQAERELLACFAITDAINTPEGVSITDNNSSSAILLAISTVMLYNRSEAEFTEFISKFSTDFADNGQIDNETIREDIKKGQENAHPSKVIERMKEFYANKGVVIQCNDFSKFIDFNGDGVIDDNDKEGLNDEPNVVVVEEDYFNTKNNVLTVLYGGYAAALQFNTAQQRLEYVRTGKAVEAAPWWSSSLSSAQIDPNSSIVGSAFTGAYTAISRINLLIDHKDAIASNITELDSDELNAIIGQAMTLRAFVYYNLALLWGNVPLVVHTNTGIDTEPVVQSQQSEVFNFALTEVEQAINMLPSEYETAQQTKCLFTKDAALMLQAEILLTLGNRTSAANILAKVAASKYSASIEDAAAIYVNVTSAKPVIFALSVENSYQPIYT